MKSTNCDKCKECDVRDICGEVLSICSYCKHFRDSLENNDCACWSCETGYKCSFISKFII